MITKAIISEVQENQCQITFSGREMNKQSEIVAYIFKVFSNHDIEISTINTSEAEISCLISGTYGKNIHEILNTEFCIKDILQ